MKNRRKQGTQDLSESIRTGAYFVEARKWYFILFSNPIAERSFYIITAAISAVCLFIAVTAVGNILPLSSEFPFFVRNNNTLDKIPKMIKLRKDHSETQDFALMRFYLSQYVIYRESYSQATFDLSQKFIANYSDQANYENYKRLMDVNNPTSPRLLFSDSWTGRSIKIDDVVINEKINPPQAVVQFHSLVRGGQTNDSIAFSANIRFLYSPLQVVPELDSVTGETVTKFQPPEFQVVSYLAQQTGAAVAPIGYDSVR